MSKKLELIKALGLRAAASAADKASLFYLYQPKEPKDIHNRLDAMKKNR